MAQSVAALGLAGSSLAARPAVRVQRTEASLCGASLGRRVSSRELKCSAFRGGEATAEWAAVASSFGPPRWTMASGTYICIDCGYIYNKRPAFDKLSADFSCPVCGSPKRRFRPYIPAVKSNANDAAVRKARKEEMKAADSALGSALPVLIGVILIGLVGLIAYLNSAY